MGPCDRHIVSPPLFHAITLSLALKRTSSYFAKFKRSVNASSNDVNAEFDGLRTRAFAQEVRSDPSATLLDGRLPGLVFAFETFPRPRTYRVKDEVFRGPY